MPAQSAAGETERRGWREFRDETLDGGVAADEVSADLQAFVSDRSSFSFLALIAWRRPADDGALRRERYD